MRLTIATLELSKREGLLVPLSVSGPRRYTALKLGNALVYQEDNFLTASIPSTDFQDMRKGGLFVARWILHCCT